MAEWLTPITDRTEADTVEAFNNQMIEAHLKGALNYSDLNRIENNYKYLIENLQKNGYYVNHKYRNYTETEPVVTEIEIPGEPGSTGGIVEPYIESTGTQYINTSYYLKSQNLALECDFSIADMSGVVPFGGGSANQYLPSFHQTGAGATPSFWVGSSGYLCPISIKSNKRTLVSVNANNGKLTATNGETTATASYSGSMSTSYPFLIFAQQDTNGATQFASMKLYGFKMYDNGVLVRDYIPKLDDNNVACLYDKVEGKYYYNAGSGSFTYGENVYSPVEYIQSSGTQYINTNFKPNQNTRVVMEAKHPSTASTSFYLGARNGWNVASFALRVRNETSPWYGEYGSASVAGSPDYKQVQTIDFNKNVLKIGTEQYTFTKSTFQCNYNLYLFALNNGGSVSDIAKDLVLYSCQIYDNDVLVRDFIPVIDSSGVALLYDQLNGEPYYNAGTGSFVAGAVIPPTPPSDPTIEYVVEYVENTYTEWFEQNLPWKSEIDRIRDNFNNLIKEYLPKSNIKTINKNQYFKFSEANKMEDVSAYTKDMNEKMEYNFIRCGEVNSGGERLL